MSADVEPELVEFNGKGEPVHLLVGFPPKMALAKIVNPLTGVSGRQKRTKFPELAPHYPQANKLSSGASPVQSPAHDWRTTDLHREAEPTHPSKLAIHHRPQTVQSRQGR